MLDWSAVFLHEVQGVDLARAGWAFVVFNFTMTVMRLVGDRVVARLGRATSVLGGGILAAAGLVLATASADLALSLLGYALVGVGCANIVPVMFSLAGAQTRMPERLAIPAVSTMGYAGVLAGPALIGFVADGTSLGFALLLVAIALAAASMLGAAIAARAGR